MNLSTDRIDDKLFLYTQKTGTAVNTVLPPFVVKELAATPRVTDKLYFWSGNGELETAVKDWQAKIRTLFDLAGVDKGENFMVSHRLRDTFAVECLLAGVPLERVSILLGHSTVKVTERHYAPWIQSVSSSLRPTCGRCGPMRVRKRYSRKAGVLTDSGERPYRKKISPKTLRAIASPSY